MWTGSRNKESGFVLVSVLMLLSVLVACTVGYAWFARTQLKRISNESFALSSRSVAYSMVLQVAKGLGLDENDYDSYREEWFGRHLIPIDGLGMITVDISPLDDIFPINCLFLPDGVTLRNEMKDLWERLWHERGQDNLGTLVLDFLDKDRKPRLGSYERDYFVNGKISDLSVLSLIEGLPADLIDGKPGMPGLKELFTPWCADKININVAPAQVLSLLDDMDRQEVDELIRTRKIKPLTSLDDLASLNSFPQEALPKIMNMVTFKSTYFEVKVSTSRPGDKIPFSYKAVLEKNGSAGVTIVMWKEIIDR